MAVGLDTCKKRLLDRVSKSGRVWGEGEVAFFRAKHWYRRNRADLIEFATPCHDAQVVRSYRVSSPLRLTVLAAKSEDFTTTTTRCHNTSEGGGEKIMAQPQSL